MGSSPADILSTKASPNEEAATVSAAGFAPFFSRRVAFLDSVGEFIAAFR